MRWRPVRVRAAGGDVLPLRRLQGGLAGARHAAVLHLPAAGDAGRPGAVRRRPGPAADADPRRRPDRHRAHRGGSGLGDDRRCARGARGRGDLLGLHPARPPRAHALAGCVSVRGHRVHRRRDPDRPHRRRGRVRLAAVGRDPVGGGPDPAQLGRAGAAVLLGHPVDRCGQRGAAGNGRAGDFGDPVLHRAGRHADRDADRGRRNRGGVRRPAWPSRERDPRAARGGPARRARVDPARVRLGARRAGLRATAPTSSGCRGGWPG